MLHRAQQAAVAQIVNLWPHQSHRPELFVRRFF
jgi:hypothetical protein